MYFVKAKGIYQPLAGVVLLLASFLMFWSMSEAQAASFAQRIADLAEIQAIRVSSDADKSRIVLDTTKEVTFKTSVLSNPERVVVDIQGAWISSDMNKTINMGSPFVKTVRMAQYDPNTVRVVIESSMNEYNRSFFTLDGGATGHRLVLDFGNVGGSSAGAAIDFGRSDSTPEEEPDSSSEEEPNSSPEEEPLPQSGSDKQTGPKIIYPDSDKSNTGSDKEKVASPVAEPVFTAGIANKKIAIDAGHGGCDTGAIGPTGVTEKSITLRIAQELQRRLEAEGAEVIMTRTRDIEVSRKRANATDIEELQARCDVANNSGADIFISIHMDSFTSSSPSGTTGYYYGGGSKTSIRLAKCVSDAVVSSLSTGHRGVKSCNFYVVKHTSMPAILLETAFISNEREERLLNSEAGIKKAAAGILNGLKNFFE